VRAIAVIGDIVGSRRAPERPALGRRVDRMLKAAVTADIRAAWQAEPIRTKGIEEISACAKRPDAVWPLIEAALFELWPARMRLAIAVGEIDVGWRSQHAAKMDGPAFHRAAEAMRRAKHEELWIALELDDAAHDEHHPHSHDQCRDIAERLLALIAVLSADWTPRMHSATRLARQGLRQDDIASRLDVTQQAVSGLLTRANAAQVFSALDAARHWLQSCSLTRPTRS